MAQARTIQATSAVRFNRFLALVYLVMAAGMAITAWVAKSVGDNPEVTTRILYYTWFTFVLFLLQYVARTLVNKHVIIGYVFGPSNILVLKDMSSKGGAV